MPSADLRRVRRRARALVLSLLAWGLGSTSMSACGCMDLRDLFSSSTNGKKDDDSSACADLQVVTSMRLSADSLAVAIAPTTSTTLSLSLVSSDTTAHQLTVLPSPGVTGTLGSFSLVPGNTTTLTLAVSASATTNQFVPVQVVASLRGSADTLTLTTRVLPPFSINSITAPSGSAGGSAGGHVFLQRAANFTQPVTFAITGLPTGWAVSYPGATATDLPFDIAIPALTPLGTYPAQATLTFGATTVQQAISVAVVAAPPPPDFTIVTTPSSVTLNPGQSGSYHVGLVWTAIGVGPATFSVSGLPAGVTGTFSRASATDTTRLTVTVPANATARTDTLTIGAVAGSGPSTIAHVARVELNVVPVSSLAIAVAPASITIPAGSGGVAGVTITRTGTVGAVTLDVPNLPNGVTAGFSAAPNTSGTITMSIGVGSSVAPGTYALTVRGTAGSLQATAPLTLIVTPPAGNDLQVQLPATLTVPAGGTTTASLALVRTGTFRGAQAQLAATLAPAGGSAWVAPSLTRADTGTVQVLGGTPGTYPLIVTATAGALVRADTLQLTVTASGTPDFQLVPQPSTLTLPVGQFTPLTLAITRVNGHTAPIALSAVTDSPGSYAVNFGATTITSQGSTTVDIYASELVARGTHLLVLRGISNGVQHDVLVTLVVQ